MIVEEIRVRGLRPYEMFSAKFSDKLTIITGKNGTGKTTLLEALYYMAQGTSFRGRDRDMISHDSTRTDILLIDREKIERRASLQLTSDDKIKKAFLINSKTSLRMLSTHKQPVVLFEPDELRLISSSPDRRRKFFDSFLARLYPEYSMVINRYQRVLAQRNELLKQRENIAGDSWNNQIFVWDIKLADLATTIVNMRREFVIISNSKLSQIYSKLANTTHHIALSYISNISSDNYKQSLLNHLSKTHLQDSYRGYTSTGPHRDDFIIQLDGHNASETASRGEMRTIMLAYKLLEVKLQQEIYDSPPLILMDDVFSELDISRENQLTTSLRDYQTIVTTTDSRGDNPSTCHQISL